MTDSNSTDIGENQNETLGSLFRKTRSGLHLSIEDAAAKTRVHARFLQDLENDNYKRMPAEVFVRGFIKLYANFLDLDPDKAMSIYVLQENAHPERPADMPYRQHILTGEAHVNSPLYQQSKKKISVIGIGLVIIALVVIIVSFLPESIDRPVMDRKTSGQLLQQVVSADNNSVPVPPPQVEPEITVDRPPAMNIEEEPASHLAAGDESSEPIERSPVLDRKPYKISKKTEKAEDSAPQVIIARDHVEPEATITAAPSPKAGAAKPSDIAQTAPIEILARPTAESTDEPSTSLGKAVVMTIPRSVSNAPDSPTPEKPLSVKVVTIKPAAEDDDGSEPETALSDDLPAKYVLQARFLESTWMRIQVDSKTPRQYTYKPGMIKTWKADRNIFLHLGNGGGVTLTLNGKPLPTGAPSGKVAKINIPDDLP